MRKSKKEIVQESIDACYEDILRMEVVRDFQATINDTKAKEQVNAAKHRIKENEDKIKFLEEYIKTCK